VTNQHRWFIQAEALLGFFYNVTVLLKHVLPTPRLSVFQRYMYILVKLPLHSVVYTFKIILVGKDFLQ